MTTTDKGSDKQKVFAYLRKSTKKAKQEQSIEKQKQSIYILANRLNIDIKNIEFFIDEGYSGFKGCVYITSNKITRQRKDFTRLLKSVKKVKEPCIVLVYDYSRLTRNIIDYIEIAKFLGVNIKQDKKIEGIYFHNGSVWNSSTNQSTMIDNVNDSLKYSEKISDNVTSSRELLLNNGIFPNDIKIPKGIERGSKYLKLSNEMPFIRNAFEMKVKGTSNKKINTYLKRNKVNISLSHIADRLWKNRFYIGEYTLPATGEVFNLKFYKNDKPISLKLFNDANDNVGLKKGKYGKKQINDLLANLLKTGKGRKFTGYIPKGRKTKQYLNNTERLYFSQNIIFDEFGEIINRICYLQYNILVKTFYSFNEMNLIEIEKIFKSRGLNFTGKIKKEFLNNQIKIVNKEDYINTLKYEDFNLFMGENSNIRLYKMHFILNEFNKINIGINKLKEKYKDDKSKNMIAQFDKDILKLVYPILGIKDREVISIVLEYYSSIYIKSYETLRNMIINNGSEEFKIQKKEDLEVIKGLEREKANFENIIKKAKNNGILNGFTKEDINDAIKEPLENIESLKEEIDEIKNNSLSEGDLNRFIDAIQKIFEHTSNMLGEANKEVKEEHYLHLIEMLTFELIFDSKKELKIKLFKGIDKLLFAYGTPTENGTPVPALRRLCPNH